MPENLTIRFDELETRARLLQGLLSPLRKDGILVAGEVCWGLYMGCKAVAAHDGPRSNQPFEDWRFRTLVPHVWGQYYELWKPSTQKALLTLNRAYLNIFIQNGTPPRLEKFVCIHCDPCESGNTLQCAYKRGPHLHVLRAEEPIPQSHFPLNFGHLDHVLSSTTDIMKAMSDSVQVLRLELLDRL
jgi:hypothetical protein